MSGRKRILFYIVVLAVIAAIVILAALIIKRNARTTVHIENYALALGSDDLFVNENANIYKLAVDHNPNYIYVRRIRSDENTSFYEEFNAVHASELSPAGFAATCYSGLVYIRGDGSIWRKDTAVTSSTDHYIRLKPFFALCSSEELSPVEGHETTVTDLSGSFLEFRFDEGRELDDPRIYVSVKLNDGKWYRLAHDGKDRYEYAAATPINKARNHGLIFLPTILDTTSVIPGTYRIEIYENDVYYSSMELEISSEEDTVRTWSAFFLT